MDRRDIPRLEARDVHARTAAGEPLLIVDIRRTTARRSGYIIGDVSYPMSRWSELEPLPRDRTLVLY